jgi:glycosyltransferase involved in cell wall biosynthesis
MKLSIVIPTCNERQYLYKTINTVINHAAGRHKLEIIVIDCGSTDGTAQAVRHKSVVVVENPRLKGSKWQSLNLGGKLAQGEIILFLDADTQLPPHYDKAIADALEDKEVVGGAFEFDYDKSSPLLWMLTMVYRLRYRFRKRFYGHQGIFVRKTVYDEIGGWPQKRLLEAAYFCEKLKGKGKLKLLPLTVKTSARRLYKNGFSNVIALDFKIWLMDFLGADAERYSDTYWKLDKHTNFSKNSSTTVNHNSSLTKTQEVVG